MTIRADLPEHVRHGIFAEPRSLPGLGALLRARARTARPTSTTSASLSIAIKLMGVPGPKLLDDEKHTQDLVGDLHADLRHARHARERQSCRPGFSATCRSTTSSTRAIPHVLDFFMQSLWNETQSNPLGARYYSCVPYLLGEGRAMLYSIGAQDEGLPQKSRACRSARPTTTCATTWCGRSPSRTSSSTS